MQNIFSGSVISLRKRKSPPMMLPLSSKSSLRTHASQHAPRGYFFIGSPRLVVYGSIKLQSIQPRPPVRNQYVAYPELFCSVALVLYGFSIPCSDLVQDGTVIHWFKNHLTICGSVVRACQSVNTSYSVRRRASCIEDKPPLDVQLGSVTLHGPSTVLYGIWGR